MKKMNPDPHHWINKTKRGLFYLLYDKDASDIEDIVEYPCLLSAVINDFNTEFKINIFIYWPVLGIWDTFILRIQCHL